MIDIVRAARALDPGVGTDWVAMGHSQGGQAALFTVQDAAQRAPELELKGAVAIAPGGVGLNQAVEVIKSGLPQAQAAEAFLPLVVLGAQAVDPSIDPESIFTPQAAPLVTAARTGCLAQIRAIPPVPAAQVFAVDADLGALGAYLARQDPARTMPRVPVMIAQGTADAVVTKQGTDTLVKTLCDRGAHVEYRVYPGMDHRATVPESLSDAQGFVSDIIGGAQTVNTCKS